MSLFRREVLEHRQSQWLGSIVLSRPFSFSLVTAAIAAIAIVAACFLVWGEYTKKARVTGVLTPRDGLIRVFPPQAGTVVERRVREGETVGAGEPLFVLSFDRDTEARKGTQAEINRHLALRRSSLGEDARRQKALQQQAEDALRKRAALLGAELAQAQAELELQASRIAIAADGARRARELRDQGFLPEIQAQQKRDELLQQQARQQAIERTRLATLREIAAVESELRDLPLKAQRDEAALRREMMFVESELVEGEARRQGMVTAPQAGTVTAILADRGQSVAPGTPLLAIVPEGSTLEAQLFAPSRAIGFVKPGQRVLLKYQAYPYQKFGQHEGIVTAVSRTALQPRDFAVPMPGQDGQGLYRITVELRSMTVLAYGKPEPLQAGMQLDADIELERRRLIEWALEPVISLRGRV